MSMLQIGDLIRRRREELGLTQEDLADGICSVPTLSRIENGDRMPVKDNLELLLQRIGYSDIMFAEWTDEKTFLLHQLKFQIRQAVILKNLEEGKVLLREFERRVASPSPLDRQFLLLHQTLLFEKAYTNEERLSRLEEALRITCPKYREDSFPRVLSYEEIILINAIAVYHGRSGNRRYAIQLLSQLRDYYARCVVCIEESLRTEPMILYNLSKFLGLEGRYDECIEICDEGIRLARETGRCPELAQTLYNRAWALEKRSRPQDRDEAKLNAKQALQMAEIMGRTRLAQHCRKFIAEHFAGELLL